MTRASVRALQSETEEMAEVIEVLRSREKKRFLEAYDSAMEAWPSERKSALIATSFGRTQVHQCGPEDAPPIILLHGMGATSAMWHPCVAALRREHRVVALDTIGDVGRSLPECLPRNAQDFTNWITEVMDELGVVRAHFVGLSYGAWLSANMAASCSDRVDRLVLLAPAAVFARISAGFLLRAMPTSFIRSPRLIRSFKEWLVHDPRAFVDPADLIEVEFRSRQLVSIPPPNCLSDDRLRSIRAATLLMIGEYEPVTRPMKAISRAERFVREIETVLVPEAGHMLTGEAPERVNAKVSEFLSTTN